MTIKLARFESARQDAWMEDPLAAEREFFTCLRAMNGGSKNFPLANAQLSMGRLAKDCPYPVIRKRANFIIQSLYNHEMQDIICGGPDERPS